MVALRLLILVASCLLFGVSLAEAAMTVERIPIDGQPPLLMLKGEFAFDDDPAILEREVMAAGARIVAFDSNGGNAKSAMAFGRKIRSLGLNTIQLRSSQCVSACALAFVGGVIRNAEPGAIGVHQASFEPDAKIDGQIAVAAVQTLTADIMSYLIEMDVDPMLLQLSLAISSSDMRYLTASEMSAFRVTTRGFVSTETPISALPKTGDATPQAISPGGAHQSAPEELALAFMERFHSAWSRPNREAITFIRSAYAETVDFYGQPISRGDVVSEKETFAARWPIRAYSVKHKSAFVTCSDLCRIAGEVEWFAESVTRGKKSSGIAEFSFAWNPVTEKIEAESGRVIKTERKPTGPGRIIAQWEDENGRCRGGSGDLPETARACERREAISAKLEAVGWCYGRPGEYGYQMTWHVCGM